MGVRVDNLAWVNLLFSLARPAGLELATYGFEVWACKNEQCNINSLARLSIPLEHDKSQRITTD
jgi:hypothetical protein